MKKNISVHMLMSFKNYSDDCLEIEKKKKLLQMPPVVTVINIVYVSSAMLMLS